MWMAYKTYPEVVDFLSGLKYLYSKFADLEFDSDHEAVYGMGKFETVENCLKLAEKYRKAKRLCSKCLKSKITATTFCEELKKLDFDGYLHQLLPFMQEFEKNRELGKGENESFSSDSESEGEEKETVS